MKITKNLSFLLLLTTLLTSCAPPSTPAVSLPDVSQSEPECQRQFEIVRKRRRYFVVFRRGGNKTKRFLAQKESSRFAVSGA